MKKFRYFPVGLLLLFVCAACQKEDTPIYGTPLFQYPLQIGNQWSYEDVIISEYFDNIDSNKIIELDTMVESYNLSVHNRDTVTYSLPTVLFQCTSSKSPLTEKTWYFQNNTGLQMVAYYASFGGVFPRLSQHKLNSLDLLFMNSFFSEYQKMKKADKDTTYYFDPPATIFKYPFVVGSSWIFRNDNSFLGPILKKVVLQEDVTVPAGTFNCYKIEYLNEFYVPDVVIYEWVSQMGLVKRQLNAKKLDWSVDGVKKGLVNLNQTISLTSYSLH